MTCKYALEIRILPPRIIRLKSTAIGEISTGYAGLASFAAPEFLNSAPGAEHHPKAQVIRERTCCGPADEGAGTTFHFTI